MDAGFLVVLAAIGVLLLVPLAFAWVSMYPQRWARVERVLGRDLPTGSDRVPPWLPWLWAMAGIVYLLMGAGRLLTDEWRRALGVLWMLQGAAFLGGGVAQHLAGRRKKAAGSVQAQVKDRAESGGPGAGG